MLDKLDVIDMIPETKEFVLRAMKFAMENPKRFRSFMDKFSYLLNWGRGVSRQMPNPSKVVIYPDHEPHSFIFVITSYRYDEEKRAIVPGGGITIGMIYHEATDSWGTHS